MCTQTGRLLMYTLEKKTCNESGNRKNNTNLDDNNREMQKKKKLDNENYHSKQVIL